MAVSFELLDFKLEDDLLFLLRFHHFLLHLEDEKTKSPTDSILLSIASQINGEVTRIGRDLTRCLSLSARCSFVLVEVAL